MKIGDTVPYNFPKKKSRAIKSLERSLETLNIDNAVRTLTDSGSDRPIHVKETKAYIKDTIVGFTHILTFDNGNVEKVYHITKLKEKRLKKISKRRGFKLINIDIIPDIIKRNV